MRVCGSTGDSVDKLSSRRRHHKRSRDLPFSLRGEIARGEMQTCRNVRPLLLLLARQLRGKHQKETVGENDTPQFGPKKEFKKEQRVGRIRMSYSGSHLRQTGHGMWWIWLAKP